MAMLFVLWLVCGGVASMIAASKGGSGLLGFFLGVALGPLGIVVACFIGSEQQLSQNKLASGEKKKCPQCAELVQPDAKVCRYCGHEFLEIEASAA